MNKKTLLLILPIIVIVCIYYINKTNPIVAHSVNKKVDQNNQIVSAKNLENFVGQSAKEAQNPQLGTSNVKDFTVNNSVKQNNQKELQKICEGIDFVNFDCYQKYYQGLVKNQGIQAAFEDLRSRYNQNNYVVAQCHPLTHVIGNIAVEKYATVEEAYAHGDSFCWSGYYHGVMEGIALKIGEKNIISQLNDICKDMNGKANYSFDYYNCVHGLGHGLMDLTGDELFDSLKMCDNLTGVWEQNSCYSGVFMENIITDNKNHFTNYLKPNDPLYPCNAVDEKYKNTCYLMQTSYMLKVNNGDFNKVFSLCEKADSAYINNCFISLGRDASGRSVSNVMQTKITCDLGKSFEARSNCIIGAVKDFISYFHSDIQAKTLCNSLSKDLQNICSDTTENYYKSF